MARNPQRLPYPDTWRARRLEVEDALTSITKDSSGNLKFTDAVSGSKTLAELVAGSLPSGNQGAILYKDAAAWAALAPGTSGQFLKTNGAAANPAWANAGGNWSVISSVVLAAAATQVDFTGLDIGTDRAYWIQGTEHMTGGGTPFNALRFNDDVTDGNYVTQYFYASGSGVGYAREANSRYTATNSGECTILNMWIEVDGHSNPRAMLMSNQNQLAYCSFNNKIICWTGTANVTKISLICDTAGGFDVGSRWRLMKLS
jgi:hypothetical protein